METREVYRCNSCEKDIPSVLKEGRVIPQNICPNCGAEESAVKIIESIIPDKRQTLLD